MEKENSRRDFIKKSAALALGSIVASTFINKAVASTVSDKEEQIMADGKFTLPALPYSYDALEPHIDKMTMEIHHSKHHQSYITNLNKALETENMLSKPLTIEQILAKVGKGFTTAIQNNAGGHYNHSLFWRLMKPNGGGEPKGKLADAIKESFTSFEEFKKQFADAATKRFGSGWAWLVVSDGKLKISSTANQDNPLMNLDSVEIKGAPIFALDVWEHAYYLKNQNRRADYIASFWNVVNWDECEKLFAAAK
jgi:Fe-Mn family superoxide dismutase